MACDYTHVVLNSDLQTAHLADLTAPSEILCGEHLRHPAVPAVTRWDCPEQATHCVDCEAVAVGHAVVIGDQLTAV